MTEHAFLEPECSVAVPAGYDADHAKLTVYVGSQIPYSDRRQVAKSLGLDDEAVRVRGTVMGGGFGGKEDIAGQVHAALAAQFTGRPVKILYTREESLRFHPKRHATLIRVKTGATRDGTLVAVEAELYGDSGAYASLGEKVMTRATTHATGPYVVANSQDRLLRHVHQQRALRRVPRLWRDPVGLCRREQHGHPGRTNWAWTPSSCGASTPCAWARRPPPGSMLRESVGLLECLDKVEGAIRRWWQETLPTMPGAPNMDSMTDLFAPVQIGPKRYAWGLAAGYKNTGLGGGAPDKAEAEVEVYRRRHAPRSAPAAPRWARTWSACWPPAPPRSWACPSTRSACW